jgi:hypothetical protein
VKKDGWVSAWAEGVAGVVEKVLVIVAVNGLPGGHFNAREGNAEGQYAAGLSDRSECWSALIWVMQDMIKGS